MARTRLISQSLSETHVIITNNIEAVDTGFNTSFTTIVLCQ